MTAKGLPLAAADMQAIAAALEPIETDQRITENPIIGRIEVIRPDGDDVCGYFVREGDTGKGEAWFGFVMP